ATSARGRPAPASEVRGGISAGAPLAPSPGGPAPPPRLAHFPAPPGGVLLVLDQLVANGLLGVRGARAQLGDAIDDVLEQVETIHVVEHDHVEGGGGGALLLAAADVDVTGVV